METIGLIDYGQNRHPMPDFKFPILNIGEDEMEVNIKRHIQFFHKGQKGITLGKLREFFTEKALNSYEHDNFIEIKRVLSDYEYEMFIDDEGSQFEINTWIPIANERIKDKSRIDEYIEKGILRKI